MTDDLAVEIRQHLNTIRRHWANTATPMNAGHGHSNGTPLPSSTIVLRADITLSLAYWVHAMADKWPSVLQHLDWGPDGKLVVVTDALDCTDVPAMAALLYREANRLAAWGVYGRTLADELKPLANAARAVSAPRADRITLGHCRCGGHITVRAVPWVRVPQPTTDPDAYPLWTDWQPEREQPIRCPGCRTVRTVPEWFAELVGVERPLPAGELIERIHADLGMRYSPQTVRVWANRGLIKPITQNSKGHSVFDRVQVYAALIDRDRRAGLA